MVAVNQDCHENQLTDKYVENFYEAYKTRVQVSASPPNKRIRAHLGVLFSYKKYSRVLNCTLLYFFT